MSLDASQIALAAFLLTFLGIVWKGASISGEMRATLTDLRETIEELKGGLKQLAEVPLLRQRVEQLEHALHLEVKGRLQTIWERLFSLKEQVAVTAARQGSSPDLGSQKEKP